MKIVKLVLILAALALVGYIGYRANENIQAKKRAAAQPAPEIVVPVESVRPQRTEIAERIRAAGSLQAESEFALFSKVSGKIARNLVRMGTAVEAGQVVAVVNRDEVGYDYKPFEIKSDAKGVVARVLLNPGSAVNPSAPLMTLIDIDTVKAVAAVDEKKIRFIKLDQPARVSLEAYPGEAFTARVTNISPVCNPANRTIEVELSLPNPGHRLKPGMYAEVEWVESRRRALVVPLAAVVDRGGRKAVFLAVDGLAKMVAVETGLVVGDAVEILSGLTGDEPVITTGAGLLNDRDKIRLVERAAAVD